MMSRAPVAVLCLVLLGGVAVAEQDMKVSPGLPGATEVPASAKMLLPPPKINDSVRIVTTLGSFKSLPKGKELPSGRLEFAFKGTVLVTGLVPGSYLKTTGNVRKEYEDVPHGKQVYFGSGRMLIVGRWGNCQWFGQNLDLTYKGSAVIRMTADFDKNLNTGQYWYDPTDKMPLQAALNPINLPKQNMGPTEAITREEYEALKKKLQGGG